ncbi:MAG: zeta toxin family protein [Fibrobacteria bacterium]|nr:zeta toxin family protein [Fibrobacteria bacterium]
MPGAKPRLRLFAGPNGSGKSTIKDALRPEWLGVYVNPDDIEKALVNSGRLDLGPYGIAPSTEEWTRFAEGSSFLAQQSLVGDASCWTIADGAVESNGGAVNSYLASVLSDFLRRKLLAAGISFTFESVMSSLDKIEFLAEAQAAGFRTYLYYVATSSPEINVERVKHRVAMGGHDVPKKKITARYHRSLELLFEAVIHTDRAYIFDNSGKTKTWIAEVNEGREVIMQTDCNPSVIPSPGMAFAN